MKGRKIYRERKEDEKVKGRKIYRERKEDEKVKGRRDIEKGRKMKR